MNQENQPQYSFDAVIPSWLLVSKEIPERAKLLYARIRALSKKEGFCYATNKFLSDETGVSERTIIRYIQILEKKKLVKSQSKPKAGGGWNRRIWLGEKVGDNQWKQGDNLSPQGDKVKADVARQGDKATNNRGNIVVDLSKDINNDLLLKENRKRYETMTAGFRGKLTMTNHQGHTEAQEDVAAELRPSGQKSWQERNEEARAFKAEQEKYHDSIG